MFTERLPLLLFLATFAFAQTLPPECSSPWLPLDTGNYWVYSTDSRFDTRAHHTVRVLGPYELAGRVYCQLEDRQGNESNSRFLRVDELGRIYQFRSLSGGNLLESLLLDPSQAQEMPMAGPFHPFHASPLFTNVETLIRTRYQYAKGVGLVSLSEVLQTGSSGGFTASETLLEAKILNKIYRAPMGSDALLSLSTDSDFANCAVPCYYAACGLGSPVDPPNTEKPCLRTRLQVAQAPPGSALVLELFLGARSLYHARFPLTSADWVAFQSIPFYDQTRVGQPVTLLDNGEYAIRLSLVDSSGERIAAQAQRKIYVKP